MSESDISAQNAHNAKGVFLLFTGNGKGKTTAALGLTLRMIGHGGRVCFIQFIKGSWKYGELEAASRFQDLLDFHVMGRGFTWKSDNPDKDIAAAREAWEFAQETIQKNQHQLVVLDELTYPITYGIIDEQEVIRTIVARAPEMHIAVTGRGAGEQLVQAADLVTEMQEVRHPYTNGTPAQKGIEF
ncbi:MAG: cob(I)yrinic acid a,c-diamide adenosyltransferase [Candidatus Electrothrix sp. YB6]